MERLYRLVFLGLFVVGFVGVIASADHEPKDLTENIAVAPVVSLIEDMRLAQEVNRANEGRWNQDIADINMDGLARVERLLAGGNTEAPQPNH